jgi:hypothetical protein
MQNLSTSERYGIGAALGLLLMVLINNAIVMLVVSIVGLIAGFWVVRRGSVKPVAFISFIAFALAAVFAMIALVRAA